MEIFTLKNILIGVGGLAVVVAAGFQLSRYLYESPRYEVVASTDGLEIRQYAPRVVAETVVESTDQQEATSEGFRRLAGYIFGGNTSTDGASRKIAMTSPVETVPADKKTEGERIAMTSPVESRAAAPDQWTITFTMPSEVTLDNAPKPNDSRVVLRELTPELVAARSFRGRSGDEVFDTEREALLAALDKAGYETTGAVTIARYDPPSVLPALRKNEVLVPVRRR